MIDQLNKLLEDGLKSSPETSRYKGSTWFSRKIKISCTLLHFIDILNDLILIFRIPTSSSLQRSLFIETFYYWIHGSLYCRSYKRKSIRKRFDQQFSLENARYGLK